MRKPLSKCVKLIIEESLAKSTPDIKDQLESLVLELYLIRRLGDLI